MNLDPLREVCSKHILSESQPSLVVFREPYIPYVPSDWNGVLVLAESQNLAKAEHPHRSELGAMNERERIDRLYNNDGIRRVGPWDDGHLKMAVELLGFDPERTAVSNAVPWTVDGGQRNRNPDETLRQCAVKFWSDIIPLMSSAESKILVITSGAVARNVMKEVVGKERFDLVQIVSSSPNNLGRVAGLFHEQDMLRRYGEAEPVIKRNKLVANQQTVFFACHVLSMKAKYAALLEAREHRSAS